MAKTDWFRRTTWTPEDIADFRQRLRRATPANRPQYLRIQAGCLCKVSAPGFLTAALELLDECLATYPNDIQAAAVHWQRALCLKDLGRPDDALVALRAAIEVQRRRPTVQVPAYLDFAEQVLALRAKRLYSEAQAVLDEFGGGERFPAERYRASAARALIAEAVGDQEAARAYARQALAAAGETRSPFPRHAKLGLVQMVDPAVFARLRELAGA